MAAIVQWRDQHHLSWHEIRIRMMKERMSTKKGVFWNPKRIRQGYEAET
jgi:hypothetical protein